jgi:hypothetical protein
MPPRAISRTLYGLARRRDLLRRQTRVALGQIALAVYLPPVLGFLALHLWGNFGPPDWRHYWDFVGRDYFLACLIVAAGMSALSTYCAFLLSVAGA